MTGVADAEAQFTLDLPPPRRRALGRGDFIVSPANADAVRQAADPALWPSGRLALTGPEGAGKTHLAHVLMAETGAARVEAASLRAADAPGLVAARTVIVEDGPPAAGGGTALLHLLNLAAAEGARVLLTGREPPARWGAAPPDLASRLEAVAVARLAPPDDALLEGVIAKMFADRALRVEPELAGFLAARIERSFAAAAAAVDRLDAAAFAAQKTLNRRFAREVLAGWSERGADA